MKQENIAIFVDIQNIYYTVKKKYQSNFNYTKFWKQATNGRKVVKAIAYGIDRGDYQQRRFQNKLRDIGFNVKLKSFIQRKDGSAKGDWDVGIALDAIETAEDVDVVVLVSGDGDFDLLMDKIGNKFDTRTEVYGVPSQTARSLINSVDCFFPINKPLLM